MRTGFERDLHDDPAIGHEYRTRSAANRRMHADAKRYFLHARACCRNEVLVPIDSRGRLSKQRNLHLCDFPVWTPDEYAHTDGVTVVHKAVSMDGRLLVHFGLLTDSLTSVTAQT